MTLPWVELLFFMLAVAVLALYGLTLSGHFPSEVRAAELRIGRGAMLMWATLVTACLAALIVFRVIPNMLPWTSIIIAGGAMLLAAPLLLRPFPDRFVNGLSGLVTFAGAALAVALLLWAIK
jgi:hypothetical protein